MTNHDKASPQDTLRDLLEFWTHESRLQTFEDRDRFRKAARATLDGISAAQTPSFCPQCGGMVTRHDDASPVPAESTRDFGAQAPDLVKRLKNRAATASAVGNSVPEYALPNEVIALLEEAAQQIDHQINVALAWKHTARSNSIALRDARSGPSEPLQCLRCGTNDAFGPVSKERK
jgi:hypothetical protein